MPADSAEHFILVVLEFELRTLHLLDRHCTSRAKPPDVLALVIFQIVSLSPRASLRAQYSFLYLLHS
jgi:hypothetical protein